MSHSSLEGESLFSLLPFKYSVGAPSDLQMKHLVTLGVSSELLASE